MSDENKPQHPVLAELEKLARLAVMLVSIKTDLEAAHVVSSDVSAMIKTLQLFRQHLRPGSERAVDEQLLLKVTNARAQLRAAMTRMHGQLTIALARDAASGASSTAASPPTPLKETPG